MEDRNEELARIIVEQFKEEFKTVHFSQNLANTIKVYQNEKGNWIVEIPAQMYDFSIYKKTGSIIPYGKGSYASRIDDTGGFSGKHKGYVDKCIDKAIQIWMKQGGLNGKVS